MTDKKQYKLLKYPADAGDLYTGSFFYFPVYTNKRIVFQSSLNFEL